MALVRFNALTGTWELQSDRSPVFAPVSRSIAQRALIAGVRQMPMWTGPKLPSAFR